MPPPTTMFDAAPIRTNNKHRYDSHNQRHILRVPVIRNGLCMIGDPILLYVSIMN